MTSPNKCSSTRQTFHMQEHQKHNVMHVNTKKNKGRSKLIPRCRNREEVKTVAEPWCTHTGSTAQTRGCHVTTDFNKYDPKQMWCFNVHQTTKWQEGRPPGNLLSINCTHPCATDISPISLTCKLCSVVVDTSSPGTHSQKSNIGWHMPKKKLVAKNHVLWLKSPLGPCRAKFSENFLPSHHFCC